MKPTKLYSKQYDSYCIWNGTAYENDGKVPGAYFYGLEKAKNNGFEPIKENTMIQDTEKTNVQFYYHEENDDLFAYFPEEKEWTEEGVKHLAKSKEAIDNLLDLRLSYAHIGQHGSCCSEYVKECRKATEKEYKDLKTELESIEYNLNII